MQLHNRKISCPYCDESIEVLLDDSQSESDYYEDCSVCCRPIRFKVYVTHDGNLQLNVLRDDD